ncbi:MAG: alpha/beta hydrolase [Mycoplasmataceae bacterium]|nr:alpha/beta hydrolase [Mycoplasmataceae bacterium]
MKHFFGKRKNIVFIHGFSSNYYVSIKSLFALYQKGFNVYACCLPNHGLNFSANHQYTFAEYIAFVQQYVTSLNLKDVILIGHSMGGGLVSAVATKLPNVSKVILVDPLNKGGIVLENKAALFETLDKKIDPPGFEGWFEAKPELNADYRSLFKEFFEEKTIKSLDKGFKSIIVPTLVIFGQADHVINPLLSSEYMLPILKRKHHSLFEVILKAKHSPQIDQTTEFLKKVSEFLNNAKK